MCLFENVLGVSIEDIEFALYGQIPWADFWLNPRRLRGSDFLMRWSQGVWSEDRLTQAVNLTGKYFVLPYGPSGTAPDDNVRAFELYFERLEKAGLNEIKRPDLLVFSKSDEPYILQTVERLGGIPELPFIPEDKPLIQALLARAVVAVECENSLWKAGQMPDYGSELRPQRRLGGQPGLKKNAVLPTVIIKQEDRERLMDWQRKAGIPIHIWHVFYDMAFGLSLSDAETLIETGRIEPTVQTFQAPGGAVSRKVIYKFYYHYAYPLGESTEEPRLIADHIVDRNGHILPFVRFEGGQLRLRAEALQVIDELSRSRS
ncbi:MAG: AccI family restriction endonuclease [Chloroflexi bacterium]|nr:AccI family restriction endonuclease [Chloroflexota bacterium]MDL1885410.1 AccI family restriction endonuclease [Anaerolineae bacterium CFX8]